MNIKNIKTDKNPRSNRFPLVSNLIFDTKIIYLCITVKNPFTGQFLNLIRIDKWATNSLNRNRYVCRVVAKYSDLSFLTIHVFRPFTQTSERAF